MIGRKIILPGNPIPLQRARASRKGFYDPQYKAKENMVWYFKKTYGECEPIEYPITLEVIFYMPIPKSWSKKKRAAMPGQSHSKKPDLDNCIKMILDTFNGILWKDDALIWKIKAMKVYALEGCTEFIIKEE